MLWVDESCVTSSDLIELDSELIEIASTEQINLEFHIQRGREAAQRALVPFLDLSGFSPTDLSFRNVNRTSFTSSFNLQRVGWAQIVTHGDSELEWSLLKLWTADKILEQVYGACVNKIGDRYQDRLDAVALRLRNQSWPLLRRQGLPIVMNPLVAPGAKFYRSGTFGNSNLSLVAGSGTQTYDVRVRVTWVSEDGVESYPSTVANATLAEDSVLCVSIANLTPPTATQPEYTTALSQYTPKAAAGWNVYVGNTDTDALVYKQNSILIPLDTDSYTLEGDPVLSGTAPGLGQDVEILLDLSSRIRRA
jgi:hypothetical protein